MLDQTVAPVPWIGLAVASGSARSSLPDAL
jgi:hypothetical protein